MTPVQVLILDMIRAEPGLSIKGLMRRLPGIQDTRDHAHEFVMAARELEALGYLRHEFEPVRVPGLTRTQYARRYYPQEAK